MQKKHASIRSVAALLTLLGATFLTSSFYHGVASAHAHTQSLIADAPTLDFHLIEHDNHVTEIGKSSTPGDIGVFSDDVFDASDTQKIGEDDGFCIALKPEQHLYQCHYTIALPDGSFTVDGLVDAGDTSLTGIVPEEDAVVGGTGKYEGTAGSLLNTQLSVGANEKEDLKVHLILPHAQNCVLGIIC